MFYNYFMAKKANYDPSSLRGVFIHQEDKRTIYAPFYSKKGFIITANNIRHYINYMVGYLASLVVFEFVSIFTKSIAISLLAALSVLVINFLSFYFNFLKKASVIENFSREKKEGFIQRQARQLDYERIYTLIICCILLVAIFAFYVWWQDLEGIYLYIVMISMVASAIYGILNVVILIYKKRNEK